MEVSDFCIDFVAKGLEYGGIMYPIIESLNGSLDRWDIILGGASFFVGKRIGQSYVRWKGVGNVQADRGRRFGLGMDEVEKQYSPLSDFFNRLR